MLRRLIVQVNLNKRISYENICCYEFFNQNSRIYNASSSIASHRIASLFLAVAHPFHTVQKMRLVAFTEDIADIKVRFSILHLDGSAMVWASSSDSANLSSLALSMPTNINFNTQDGPSTTTVLPGGNSLPSKALSDALSRRTGIAVYAYVSLPPGTEPLSDSISVRLLRELLPQES